MTWGGYSVVEVQLRALARLVRPGAPAGDVVVNLSGQDAPLLPRAAMRQHLAGQGARANWVSAWPDNVTAAAGAFARPTRRVRLVRDEERGVST